MSTVAPTRTYLERSPFYLLGVTIRDGRQRIVEQAEVRALEIDAEVCQSARAQLINPRSRLSAELAWLPGIAPKAAEALVSKVSTAPTGVRALKGLPSLAKANLLAAALEATSDDESGDAVAIAIVELSIAAELVRAEEVLRDLNEDRAVAGFPRIPSVENVTEELAGRMRGFRDLVRMRLDSMESGHLVEVLRQVVSKSTSGGLELGPGLVHDLIDNYEIEAQRFFDRQREAIAGMVGTIENKAANSEKLDTADFELLERLLREFVRVAKPILLSKKARGLSHDISRELAAEIRDLGVDLWNKHDLLDSSSSLNGLVRKYFADLPDIAERVAEDATAIERLSAQAAENQKQRAEWEENVSFKGEVGAVFKSDLEISPAGIRYKGKTIALDAVTGVRWGGVKHSVNGIPTGTTYQIGVTGNSSTLVIDLRKESTYSGFLKALWPAVCGRLIVQTCAALEQGQSLTFGDMAVENDAVTLTRHKFLRTESVRLGWRDVQVWNANGSFVIGAKAEKKVTGSASYIQTWNTHVLEHIVLGAFRKGVVRLSDFLRE